jgi:hypothetical protein
MIGVRPKSESHHLVIDSSLLIIDERMSALSSNDARCVARGRTIAMKNRSLHASCEARGAHVDER